MANAAQISEYRDILDARSPAEYAEDHIPGALNVPAFSNAERAAVGTLYNADPFAARRQGAALFTANLAAHLSDGVLANRPPDWAPLVYCARGGQRSGGMVEVLRRIGWRAEQLDGGYKAYRRHIIAALAAAAREHRWVVIAGKTGVGKTRLLAALAAAGAQVIDLEQLANHRGSVFGGDAEDRQPAQRRFETLLAAALAPFDKRAPIFIEAESRKIGRLHIPPDLLAAMRAAPAARLEAPLEERVRCILEEYQEFCADPKRFFQSIEKLTPFAGHARIAQWRARHQAGEWQPLVAELLTNFYDIGYEKSLTANYTTAASAPPIHLNPNAPQTLTHTAHHLIKTHSPA